MASARFWQPPGMPQVIWMAGLPSLQVTMVALVSELGSGPGVVLGSAQAAARTARPRPSIHRIVVRETMFSPRLPAGDRTRDSTSQRPAPPVAVAPSRWSAQALCLALAL